MLDELLKKYVDSKHVPGIVVGVVNKDKTEYHSCGKMGYPEFIDNPKDVNEDTIYDLASCSKVVATTTMILKLIEEGYFDINTLVKDIIPEFKFENIRIWHLLTHTSGLVADNKDYKKCNSRAELWQFTLKQDVTFKEGSKVDYSDFGFIILGKIIEKYKGSLEDYASELIFKPLGMSRTMYNPYLKGFKEQCCPAEVTKERGVIQGIVHDGKANKLDGLSGNAGVFSSVKDLSKFVLMYLNNGSPILKKETIELVDKSYTKDLNISRTLGWIYNDPSMPSYPLGSEHSLYHTGFSGSSIYIDLEKQMGIVILTNRVHPTRVNDISDIRKEVHQTILKEYQ